MCQQSGGSKKMMMMVGSAPLWTRRFVAPQLSDEDSAGSVMKKWAVSFLP